MARSPITKQSPNRSVGRSSIGAVLLLTALSAATLLAQAPPAWTQWGGPTRDFMVNSTGLANSWPAGGPKRLWTRALGEGHSAILVEGGRLYTMYRPLGLLAAVRRSQEEVVTALDAASGKTIWEYRYASPTAGADFSQGAGPHATPLIVGNRLFAVGSRREFFALDKNTGKVLWSHDLIKDYGAPSVNRGMANSPLLYNNTILLPIGGKSQALQKSPRPNHRPAATMPPLATALLVAGYSTCQRSSMAVTISSKGLPASASAMTSSMLWR